LLERFGDFSCSPHPHQTIKAGFSWRYVYGL